MIRVMFTSVIVAVAAVLMSTERVTVPAIQVAAATRPNAAVAHSGPFVYIGGMVATDAAGEVVSADSKTQCEIILTHAAKLLELAGSSLANVTNVTVYLRAQSDYAGMNQALRMGWPTAPPARTTVMVEDLPYSAARVVIAFVAVANGADRAVVTPASWRPMPYSYGIKVGDMLFLAGLVSRDPTAGANVAGDIRAQTTLALENGGQVLHAGGMSFRDVVSARVYIAGAELVDQMDAVYRKYFPAEAPPRVVVTTGFPSTQYLIEISLTAVQQSSGRRFLLPVLRENAASTRSGVDALEVGGLAFVAGTGVGRGSRATAGAQVRTIVSRAERPLKTRGFSWSQLVDGVLYVRNSKDSSMVAEAYRSVTGSPAPLIVTAPPARAGALVEAAFTVSK